MKICFLFFLVIMGGLSVQAQGADEHFISLFKIPIQDESIEVSEADSLLNPLDAIEVDLYDYTLFIELLEGEAWADVDSLAVEVTNSTGVLYDLVFASDQIASATIGGVVEINSLAGLFQLGQSPIEEGLAVEVQLHRSVLPSVTLYYDETP